jgi:SAM-dependent methyltransferase
MGHTTDTMKTESKQNLKKLLKSNLPRGVVRYISTFRANWAYRYVIGKTAEDAFGSHYSRGSWGGRESASGAGSDFAATLSVREELPRLLQELGVKVILDAPCGDFFWMQQVSLDGIQYIGADIVQSVVQKNIELHENQPLRRFIHADITRADLPKSDLVLCRDCFIHLSFQDIALAIQNFQRSGAVYLLTTTYPSQKINWDIHTGACRPVALMAEPFAFPPPITLIDENLPSGAPEGEPSFMRSLGLWKLENLRESKYLRSFIR